jgi:hypothetical protein
MGRNRQDLTSSFSQYISQTARPCAGEVLGLSPFIRVSDLTGVGKVCLPRHSVTLVLMRSIPSRAQFPRLDPSHGE